MSRFYVSAQGSRGEATRCGTAGSGVTAHPRGWNLGVRVDGSADSDRFDRFTVSITGGSNGGREVPTLHVIEQPNGERVVTVKLPGRPSESVRYTSDWRAVSPVHVADRCSDESVHAYRDFGSNRPNGGHWHTVPAGGPLPSIETDHEAWHDSDAPCITCGRVSFTAGGHHTTPSGLPLAPCYRGEVAS